MGNSRSSHPSTDITLKRLRDLQIKTIELQQRLRAENIITTKNSAAPFLSQEREGYFDSEDLRILFVGKATRGDLGLEAFMTAGIINDQLEERLRWTRGFLELVASKQYSSPFWKFARSLGLIGVRTTSPVDYKMQNLVWTNIAKIGVRNRNPSGKCLKLQTELSIDIFIAEIEYYKPDLIYIAHSNFGIDILRSTFGDSGWNKP